MGDWFLIPVVAGGWLCTHRHPVGSFILGYYRISASRSLRSRKESVHSLSRASGAQAQEFHNL